MSTTTFAQHEPTQAGWPQYRRGAPDLAAMRSRHLLERLRAGDLARVDLARELQLSHSAVSSLVAELPNTGLIQQGGGRGAAPSGPAQTARTPACQTPAGQRQPLKRRATPLSLNERAAFLLATGLSVLGGLLRLRQVSHPSVSQPLSQSVSALPGSESRAPPEPPPMGRRSQRPKLARSPALT